MKKLIATGVIFITLVSLIVGCTDEVYSYYNFSDDLQDTGAAIQIGNVSKGSAFPLQARNNIVVNDEVVQVFEFESEALADGGAALIFPDGQGMSVVNEAGETTGGNSWTLFGEPHFYKKGRLIVQYVDVGNDSDSSTRSLLEGILGSQFAGSQ
ncbi:hypothetical protein ACFLYB_03025 [Chloroflexota bacterium]